MDSNPLFIDDAVSQREQIARRAHALWEQFGRPEGCDLDIWLTAEALSTGSDSGPDTGVDDGVRLQELREAFPAEGDGMEPINPALRTQTGRTGRMPARYKS